MMKLITVTLLAFLIPIFWVMGVKAEMSHYDAWTQTADVKSMKPTQKQPHLLRQEISSRLTAMSNLYRMMNASSRFIGTARDLLSAAEQVQTESNRTTNYFELEAALAQVQSLHSAQKVLSQLQ